MNKNLSLLLILSTVSCLAMEDTPTHHSSNISTVSQLKKHTIDPIKRLFILSHLLVQKNSSEFNSRLRSNFQRTVNLLPVELAVNIMLPEELRQKIMHYVNKKNVFIAELLKQVKQPENILITEFQATAGLRATVLWNDQIITGGAFPNNVIEIRHRISEKLTAQLQGHTNWIRTMTRCGNVLFSGDDEGTIKIWDLVHKTCLKTLHKAHGFFVKGIALNDNLMISVAFDQKVKIWDLGTYTCKHELLKHHEKLNTVIVMNDKIITAGDDAICVWSLHGECLHMFMENSWSLAVIDDNTFVSAGYDCFTIYRLDTKRSETKKTSLGGVRSIAFVPDNLIIAGSTNGIFAFYEFPSLELLATIPMHEKSIFLMSAEGTSITTASYDNKVKTWDVSLLRHLPRLKKILFERTSFLEGSALHTLNNLMLHKIKGTLTQEETTIIKELKTRLKNQFGPVIAVILQEMIAPYLLANS